MNQQNAQGSQFNPRKMPEPALGRESQQSALSTSSISETAHGLERHLLVQRPKITIGEMVRSSGALEIEEEMARVGEVYRKIRLPGW